MRFENREKRKSSKFVVLNTTAMAAMASAGISHGATTQTWNSTTAGTGQNWTTAGNWQTTTPGSSDIALFSNKIPSASTVNLNFSGGSISVGAIEDSLLAPQSLTLSGQNTGSNFLILNGATVTAPFTGPVNETVPNTILSFSDTSSTTNKNLILDGGINLALTGTTNNILGYRGLGTSGSSDSSMPKLTIAGNITDASPGVHAGITFLGGGSGTADGAELFLGGNNTFSGGLTIGSADGTQGGEVQITKPSNLPSTGTITINEQGQLAFGVAGAYTGPAYSTPGQLMVLNGIGVNKNISGAIRATGGTQAAPVVWQGNIQLGTSAASDLDSGYVLTTVAKAGSWFKLTGNLSGGGFLEQGSGIFDLAGTNNTYGGTQLGNGGIYVEPTSSLGTGDVTLFQTSTNNPTLTLNNPSQTIGSLVSKFTQTGAVSVPLNANGYVQNITLNGTTLTVTQPANTTFGYGNVVGYTSGINDGTNPGSLVVNSVSGHSLTLSGPSTYSGGTTINAGTLSVSNLVPGTTLGTAGSATGSGPVVVNSGGTLASGGFVAPTGFSGAGQTSPVTVTAGVISGAVILNNGGIISPGGANTVGQLNVGSLTANNGSILNFDVNSPSAGNFDNITSAGGLTLPAGGTETVNITGSKLTFGTFTLMNYSGLTNGGTAFTLGSTPGGAHRTYSLSTDATTPNMLVLTIVDTGNDRVWSTNGSGSFVDGSGTWQSGSTSFFQLPGNSSFPYNNADSNDVIFGHGGSGGLITIGTPVTAAGNLILGALSPGQSYTLGTVGTTNSITTVGGIAASNNTTVNAPVILGASQGIATDNGVVLTLAGGVSQSGGSNSLTKTGGGTLVLSGTGTYSGGTVISQGILQTTTAGVPAAGGISNSAILDFDQTTVGTYSGAIGGSGGIVVSNNAGTGTPAVTLSNTGNNYTGSTTITGGTLVVPDIRVLGTGDGGIVLSGGTFQAGATLDFPLNDGLGGANRTVTLTGGTTSVVDTHGSNITFEQNIRGTGNLTKIGAGTLTLAGVPSTTVIGTVVVTAGTFAIAPPSNIPSFGFAGSTTTGQDTGKIEVVTPIELRLQGGDFSGGGTFQVDPTGILIIAKNNISTTTTIGNNIVLNPNNLAGFSFRIGADTGAVLALNSAITGTSDVDFTGGPGTVNLAGHSTYVGGTTIDNSTGGSVTLMANDALPTSTDVHVTHTGVFDLNGFNQTVNSIDAGTTNITSVIQNFSNSTNSTLTISASVQADSNSTYNGILQDQTFGGTLGITIKGIADVSLPTPELYSGPINILGGRLQVFTVSPDDNSTGLGSASSISIGGGPNPNVAQLRFNGTVGTVSYVTANHPNAIPPTITLNSMGGYNDGVNPVDDGAIRIDNSATVSIPNNIVFAADSSIDVTSSSTATLTGNLSGTGTLNSLGAGILTLTGTNSPYTGGTTMQGGTLNVNSASAIGTGPLQVNNVTNPSGSPTGTAVVLNLNNATQSVGSLSGAIASTPVGNTASINLSPTVLTVNQTTDASYAGTIVGSGSLIVNGTATLTIGSTGSISVPTTVHGKLAFGANTGSGILVQALPSLTIASPGLVTLADPGAGNHANRTVLVTPLALGGSPVAWSGKVNLTTNDLIVKSTTAATVFSQLQAGFNAHTGYWNGAAGILSSAAAGDTHFLTTLGYRTGGSVFDSVNTTSSDILVKYTYYGDADLNGTVNGADYTQIDHGFAMGLTGWQNGDFNYDGVVDGSDYSLIDNTFNQVSATGALSLAILASPSAQIAGAADLAATSFTNAVPEPATFGLLAIGAMGLLAKRRRRA